MKTVTGRFILEDERLFGEQDTEGHRAEDPSFSMPTMR